MKRLIPLLFLVACNERASAPSSEAESDTEADAGTESDTESEAESGEPGDAPTFYQDIAPLLATHCRGCHAPDAIAPFPLDTYAEVRDLAPIVAVAVEERMMPPWHVGDDGSCNTYKDARSLTDEEVATFRAWAEAGAPAGEETEIPPPVQPPSLEHVDQTLVPVEAYSPNEALSDDYRCFIIDPQLPADRFLTGFEVHPGAPSVVHHVVLYSVDTDEELATANDLDAAEAGPGYTCYGGSMTGGGRSLLVWTPGTGATRYPEGTGLRLLGGRPVIMQVHYYGGGVEDLSSIDITLADDVASEALITGTYDLSLAIPPGKESYVEAAAVPLPAWSTPMKIHAVYPHMHTYGRTLRVDYDRGADSRCLVNVPDYDFDWQQFFFYEEPIVLDPPGGGHFRITCSYDTTAADEMIFFGEGTGDEMCIAALYVTY